MSYLTGLRENMAKSDNLYKVTTSNSDNIDAIFSLSCSKYSTCHENDKYEGDNFKGDNLEILNILYLQHGPGRAQQGTRPHRQ